VPTLKYLLRGVMAMDGLTTPSIAEGRVVFICKVTLCFTPYLLSFLTPYPLLWGKRKHRMKLSLPRKLVEKLVWVPVICFCKIFILSYMFDALLCWNWPFLSHVWCSIMLKLAILAPCLMLYYAETGRSCPMFDALLCWNWPFLPLN
jgi:hypothetical protein